MKLLVLRLLGWPLAFLALSFFTPTPARSQVTLYVSFSAQINSYNANTGAFVTAPLTTGISLPWQMALDGSGRIYTALQGTGNVDIYSASNGAVLASNFLSVGINGISGLALDGNNLYVASTAFSRISLYNATTGALINQNFITGLANPNYLLTDGNGRLFVSNGGTASIGVYSSATGAAINSSFVTGLSGPMGLAIDGNNRLYVANVQGNSVGVFNATTGSLITSSLIAGLSSPRALALDPAGNLYVSSFNLNNSTTVVGRYNALTGAAQNAALLSVGSSISSLGFVAVPEPSTWALLASGLGLLWLGARRRRAVTR